jgi:hypothetical protein
MSSRKHRGRAYLPYAFTEQGVAVLSSVLRSTRAVQVNIAIMRTFVQLRRLMDSNRDLARRIDSLEKKYDEQFQAVFNASRDGQRKEGEITKTISSEQPTHDDIRHGFVYERVPHITLKSIANNAEIDVIWEQSQKTLEPLREQLNKALKQKWEEWQIPRDLPPEFRSSGHESAPSSSGKSQSRLTPAATGAEKLHAAWWEARIARQKAIDASIADKAEFEFLYDKPYDDKSKVRVAGPFTVESISPHRVLTVGENDEIIDGWKMSETKGKSGFAGTPDFTSVILENLKLAGVQQAHKEDRLTFTSLVGWPGKYICAEGRYLEGKGDNALQKRAAIFIGPEFGTVSRPDLFPPPAKPPMPISTCLLRAPSITTRTPPSSRNLAASPCSKPA